MLLRKVKPMSTIGWLQQVFKQCQPAM